MHSIKGFLLWILSITSPSLISLEWDTLQPRLVRFSPACHWVTPLATKLGSWRFGEPQLPLYTPGVQLANKQPSQCFQAKEGTAPKTPFRNATLNISPTRRLETRGVSSTELESTEDCLFLKYIFMLIDMCDTHYDGHDSVYIPGRLGEKKNLPVIVWIHGYLLAP